MSTRLQTTIAAAAASLALGLLAPGLASAAACHSEAGTKQYFVCVNGTRLGSSTEVASETLKGTLPAGKKLDVHQGAEGEPHYTCEGLLQEGEVKSGGGAGVVFSFSKTRWEKCKAAGTLFTQHCALTPIEEKEMSWNGNKASYAGTTELVLHPTTEFEVWGNVQFEKFHTATCLYTMQKKLTRELPCKVPLLPSETAVKTAECAGTLKWLEEGGVHVEYSDALELSGVNKGKSFSVYEGS